MQGVLNGLNAHLMAGSKLSYSCLPVTFDIGSDFGEKIQNHDLPAPVIPLLVHGGFPLLHSLHDFINLGLPQRPFAIGSLCIS